jgi:IS5 family transposase
VGGHELMRVRAAVDWSAVDRAVAGLYRPGRGRPAYPPRVLFRVLVLEAYAGLSDVAAAEQCRFNALYRAFVGLGPRGRTPDDTTLVVFRRRLGPARVAALFDALVAQCRAAGLVGDRLKLVDATHVWANAADPRRPGRRRRRPPADPEARHGRAGAGARFYGYKVHVAQDAGGVVTSVQVLPGDAHEGHRLPALLSEEAAKGLRQAAVAADRGYDAAANRAAVRALGAAPLIPRQGGRRQDPFVYDPAADALRCPAGHASDRSYPERGTRRFTFPAALCRACPLAAGCPPPNAGRVRATLADHHLAHLHPPPPPGLADPKAAADARRAIERTFAWAKGRPGLRRARYRGAAKLLLQALLAFFALNARRLARHLASP